MDRLPNFFEAPRTLTHRNDEKILVALSGGSDSVCLLHLMLRYAQSANIKICAAHVNHGIRGEEYGYEAQRDEIFCKELCQKYSIELFVKRCDVPSYAKSSHQSLEGAARDVRYSFFKQIMNENGIYTLALAHNANDRLETQLFNLARGCSVSGITGIKQVRSLDGVDGGLLIRPILSASKDEIFEYCRQNQLEFVTDSTNFECDATRNKIRSSVIPSLTEIFPSCLKASERLSFSAEECHSYIAQQADAYINSHMYRRNGRVCLPYCSFDSEHIAMKRQILYATLKGEFQTELEYTHICSVIELAQKNIPHSRLSLPNKLTCAIEDGALEFYREDDTPRDEHMGKHALSIGINKISDTFSLYITNRECEAVIEGYSLYSSCRIMCDDISDMYACERKEGDLITDGGNRKKLKKLMCDKKIPLQTRSILPIIHNSDEIIYVPRCAVADPYKPKGDGGLYIYVYTNNDKDHL